jgi:hypothetical protein
VRDRAGCTSDGPEQRWCKADGRQMTSADPIALPWGPEERLPLKLPPTWQVVVRGDLETPPPIADLSAAIRQALETPLVCAPLRELVGPETRIALVMDDAGRPTPVSRMAPAVLDYLIEAGADPEKITGLFAIGTHRVMSFQDMEARAGPFVCPGRTIGGIPGDDRPPIPRRHARGGRVCLLRRAGKKALPC